MSKEVRFPGLLLTAQSSLLIAQSFPEYMK